ncbi:MAG: hypothetical protein RJA49_637 [Actinomycetota bacterium]
MSLPTVGVEHERTTSTTVTTARIARTRAGTRMSDDHDNWPVRTGLQHLVIRPAHRRTLSEGGGDVQRPNGSSGR